MDPDLDFDPDPDPAIFVIDLQDASTKLIFLHNFFCWLLLKLHLHYILKIKSQKESQNSRIQGFSYYFCIMIEGSESGSRGRSRSGYIPLTSGSGHVDLVDPNPDSNPDPEHCCLGDKVNSGIGLSDRHATLQIWVA
jgi:hypothetical protein